MREEIEIINEKEKEKEKEEIQKFWDKEKISKNCILSLFIRFKIKTIGKLFSLWILIIIGCFGLGSLDPDNFGFTGNFVIDYFSIFFILALLVFIRIFLHLVQKKIIKKTFLQNSKDKNRDFATKIIVSHISNRINNVEISKRFLVNLSLKLDLITFFIIFTTSLVISVFYWIYFSLASKIFISLFCTILILMEYFGKPNIAYLKLQPIFNSQTKVTIYETKKIKKIKYKKMTFQLKVSKNF